MKCLEIGANIKIYGPGMYTHVHSRNAGLYLISHWFKGIGAYEDQGFIIVRSF